jgi:hypothetical protein
MPSQVEQIPKGCPLPKPSAQLEYDLSTNRAKENPSCFLNDSPATPLEFLDIVPPTRTI